MFCSFTLLVLCFVVSKDLITNTMTARHGSDNTHDIRNED